MAEEEKREDPQEDEPSATDDERTRRREEALARAAQRRREREGAVERNYEPSPLEATVRFTLQELGTEIDYSLDELAVRAPADRIVEICRALKETPGLEFTYLRCLSVVDYQEELEVLYHLSSLTHPYKVVVKARVPAAEPHLPSVIPVWRGADWHEREVFDLSGIHFSDHPNLRRILCPEDWVGYPLRKDYQMPTEYHGIRGE